MLITKLMHMCPEPFIVTLYSAVIEEYNSSGQSGKLSCYSNVVLIKQQKRSQLELECCVFLKHVL